jgi:hypothetical protein
VYQAKAAYCEAGQWDTNSLNARDWAKDGQVCQIYNTPEGPFLDTNLLIGISSFIFLARIFFNKGVALVKEPMIYFMNKKGHKSKPCFLRESKFLI